ncbi:hypothetical protein C8F04DRAFT_1110563 [Mycena alexandri]|uniref:Uncharacterized protein n=1 Tax=Mycena alexandri TaxID=1745969 RepID=A0AAD6SP50_9AGAR|nr:hypothetical protein C8F04DRAFT_1110563 [Mycena alexandri]
MTGSNSAAQRYRPFPWPWVQPSILTTVLDDERRRANYWLDVDLDESDDSSSDYVAEVPEDGDSDASSSDSEEQQDSSTSDGSIIGDSETFPFAYAIRGTGGFDKIAELAKAEEDAAAVYNADEVVSLITQLYELFIAMGHWPEGSLRYAPHTDPPVNEGLAKELGYAPACISLMHRLPYLTWEVNGDEDRRIVSRSRFADYTLDEDLQEGRRGYPHQFFDGCPDYDPWLLPIMLPDQGGLHLMLDTAAGTVRAYHNERGPEQDTVEWRRHGEIGDSEEGRIRAHWTDYRRAALVPAALYFSEVIFAYSSRLRLPIVDPDRNDPRETRYRSYGAWRTRKQRGEWQTLLALYRECGWPDQWLRAEFLEKWAVVKEEIKVRA